MVDFMSEKQTCLIRQDNGKITCPAMVFTSSRQSLMSGSDHVSLDYILNTTPFLAILYIQHWLKSEMGQFSSSYV